MKHQVVAIHGGTCFDTYEQYIEFLHHRDLTLEKLMNPDDWRSSLAGDLGDEWEVLSPKMPNASNARYAEWLIWFERCLEFMRDDVVLIGHSLGGIFLAKYLAQHTFPLKIKAIFLVAAPFGDTSDEESLTDFELPESIEGLAAHGELVYIVHSEDDPVVPFAQAASYQKALPQAKQLFFTDRGHFNQKHFPELVALLQKGIH